jgi:Pectate lyase superfamily protein
MDKPFNSNSSNRRRFLSNGGALLAAGGTLLGAGADNLFGQGIQPSDWFNVVAFGAKGNGVTDDSPAIQNAVDALAQNGRGVLYFPPSRRYLVAEEVQLRADNMTVWLWGAEILGPTGGTAAGGLMTVVDRRNLSRIFSNVSVYGGLINIRSTADNGLNVVTGHHVLFCGVRVAMTPGRGAFAIQADTSVTSSRPAAQYIKLTGCECYGSGYAGVSLEFAGIDNLLADIIVENVSVKGVENAVLCSNTGSTGLSMYRITVSNGTFTQCGTGIFLNGVKQSVFDNLIMEGASFRGIEAHEVHDCLISNVSINGQSGSNAGVVLFDYARLNLTNFDINGPFTFGVYNAMYDATIGPGKIRGSSTGVTTVSDTQRSVYSGVEFDTCATLFNAYRAGDQYFKIVERRGTKALLIRDDTTVSAA